MITRCMGVAGRHWVGIAALIFTFFFTAGCNAVSLETSVLAQPLGESARAGRLQNLETLKRAQDTPVPPHFGFAPLLLDENSRVVIKSKGDVRTAWLIYPQQPADPGDWTAGDSFVFAYAAQQRLQKEEQVRSATLGSLNVDASVGMERGFVGHTAVWVTFTDRSQAVMDLSPLAVSLSPRHFAKRLHRNAAAIEAEFAERREGVDLRRLRPLNVVLYDGQLYYLLVKLLALSDRYEFLLQAHRVTPANPNGPLRLSQGVKVTGVIGYEQFEPVQSLLTGDGPRIFNERPELLTRTGDPNLAVNAVLDDHLYLMWHLITKVEHPAESP